MRTFEEYMKLPYKLEIIPDTEESGFVASYPELPGCITCGKTVAEVVANADVSIIEISWQYDFESFTCFFRDMLDPV